jgi:hypothetical protein
MGMGRGRVCVSRMSQARPLRPLGRWDLVSRGRFEAHHLGHVWTVDLDYFDFGEKLHLYRDGVEVEVQSSPAKFELGQRATIEASMGLLGMRQIDLVVNGETTMLTPADGTAEAWRLKLARERPETSRLIGAVSWTVLVVALIYELPQLVALIDSALGADIEAPFTLPGAANFALGIAALAAALERALRFKSNRWLG